MQNIERAPLGRAPQGSEEDQRSSLLYPLMLIAAIAVIVFSIVSIASLMGVMPRALSSGNAAADSRSAPARGETPQKPPAAGEPRSGVKSIRAIQTRAPTPPHRVTGRTIVATG